MPADRDDADLMRSPAFPPCMSRAAVGLGEDFWTRLLIRLGLRLRRGSLVMEAPGGERLTFQAPGPGPRAVILLRRPSAGRSLIIGGPVGFAESYLDGAWDSPDLTALFKLAELNRDVLDDGTRGLAVIRLLDRLRHLGRDNTRRGSRRNIAHHYDLGNDFYRAWLDAGMTYSSGLYARGVETLEQAQQAKYERVCALLGPGGGGRVLEIGCGWGAMAEVLAGDQGCRVVALTLSREQAEYVRVRLFAAGLADAVDVRLQDYRDVEGLFDRIVSIEMLEAVGERHWPRYFRTLHDRLRPGGVAVLQVITIDEARFESYRRGADFIQRHVFPGGMLPSKTILRDQVRAAGLRLTGEEAFGRDYARTLAEWQRRFQHAWPEIETRGFDTRFKRLWEYYLSYCEAGFLSGTIDVGLYRIERPS